MKFHIIIAMFNVEEWIEENIQWIKEQTYENIQVILVDDISTDRTVEIVQSKIQGDNRFKLIINQKKKYKARNVVEAIDAAIPDDEDVIVIVDGDDRLSHKDVLKHVAEVYQQENCWMTYGSYENSQGDRGRNCRPYQADVINNNSYRKSKWLASHLKTFRYELWKKLNMDIFKISDRDVRLALTRTIFTMQFRSWYHWKDIKAEDLHDQSGNFIRRIDDKAFSYPMLEISGDKARFIDEILYIFHTERAPYNGPDKNYGENKSEKWHTRLIRHVLAHKKPYKRVEKL